VAIVTCQDSDGPAGLTTNAVTSLSLDPPLVLVCFDNASRTLPIVREAGRFAVNILAAEQEALSRRFAAADSTRRFDGIGYRRAESGVILLDDALAHLECRMFANHPAGDHTIFVGEVERATARSARPLLYYRGGYAQLER